MPSKPPARGMRFFFFFGQRTRLGAARLAIELERGPVGFS